MRTVMMAVLLAAAPALVTASCSETAPATGTVTQAYVLEPAPETIWVRPGDQGAVRFRLHTPEGVPLPMQRVSFVIVDDPSASSSGSQSQGATLSAATAVTDAAGIAEVGVTAGQLAVFRVRGSFGEVEAEAVVVVATGLLASVEVAPFLTPGSAATADVTRIELLFFDNMSCHDLSFSQPPAPARTVRSVTANDGAAQYDFVSTGLSHAVFGRGRDVRGGVLARGCVDLPGTALSTGGVVRITLPLTDASPGAAGRFAVTSRFTFPRPLAVTASLVAPWRDLQDCPLDPGQLWLDCTVDALSGEVAGDPNDCQPQAPALEGALGTALAARRGGWLPLAGGGPSSCRGATDGAGMVSHDALLMGLFGSPKPRPLVDLALIADDAEELLGSLMLRSELLIRPASDFGTYQATHSFTGAVFSVAAATYEVLLRPLALPVLEASARATDEARTLTIAPHGITLRLGTVARVAFGQLALVRRGLPAGTPATVESLTMLAKTPAAATTPTAPPAMLAGCAALDAVLCRDLGQPQGCLLKACQDGLAALAVRLDAGFSAADGDGEDFVLDGAAPLLDPHGTGLADRLGDSFATPGTWSARLDTGAAREQLTGLWDAFRVGN